MTFDLTGKLLISTPALGDPRFARSVVFLCAHSAGGAFGLVVNRPIADLTLAQVLAQLSIPADPAAETVPVFTGGPVEGARGFVLHRDDMAAEGESTRLPGGLALSASTAMLAAIARGEGPTAWLLALGYAGWGPGQLEAEIAQNAWLTCEATPALIFAARTGDAQWQAALRSMGIDPLGLSSVAGHA